MIRTLIHDLETDEQLYAFEGAVWPPIGAVIELPTRVDVAVIGVRLTLPGGGDAHIIVDVRSGGYPERIPREAFEFEPATQTIDRPA
jgi:hypothetical protein